LPSLSCGYFHSANQQINSSLSPGTHPVSSNKLTPTVSVGINTNTPGLSYSFTLHIVIPLLLGTHPFCVIKSITTGNTSHRHIAIGSIKAPSLLRFVHTTVGASFGSRNSLPTLLLLVDVCALSTVGLPSRIFHAVQPAIALRYYCCSIFSLTKQSSLNHSCSRSVDPRLRIVLPIMALLHFFVTSITGTQPLVVSSGIINRLFFFVQAYFHSAPSYRSETDPDSHHLTLWPSDCTSSCVVLWDSPRTHSCNINTTTGRHLVPVCFLLPSGAPSPNSSCSTTNWLCRPLSVFF
jgi:hypothetical protein